MAVRLYAAQSGPIEPVGLVGDNVAVWLSSSWWMYQIDFWEQMPRGQAMVVDLGALAAGANTGDQRQIVFDQQVNPPGMMQLRCFPLDDIQIQVKMGTGNTRFVASNIQAQIDRYTELSDPDLHSTEFFVLRDNSVYLNCTNPTAYATAMSRVAFFGNRYNLTDLKKTYPTREDVLKNFKNVAFLASGRP